MEHYRDDKQGRRAKRRVVSYLSDVDQNRLSSGTDFAVSQEDVSGEVGLSASNSSNLNDVDIDRLGGTTDLGKIFTSDEARRRTGIASELADVIGSDLSSNEFEVLRGESDFEHRRRSSGNPYQQTDLQRLVGATDFGSMPEQRTRRTRKRRAKKGRDARRPAGNQQAPSTPQMSDEGRNQSFSSQSADTTQAMAPTVEREPRQVRVVPTMPPASSAPAPSVPAPSVPAPAPSVPAPAPSVPMTPSVVVPETRAAVQESAAPRVQAPAPRPVEPAYASAPRVHRAPKPRMPEPSQGPARGMPTSAKPANSSIPAEGKVSDVDLSRNRDERSQEEPVRTVSRVKAPAPRPVEPAFAPAPRVRRAPKSRRASVASERTSAGPAHPVTSETTATLAPKAAEIEDSQSVQSVSASDLVGAGQNERAASTTGTKTSHDIEGGYQSEARIPAESDAGKAESREMALSETLVAPETTELDSPMMTTAEQRRGESPRTVTPDAGDAPKTVGRATVQPNSRVADPMGSFSRRRRAKAAEADASREANARLFAGPARRTRPGQPIVADAPKSTPVLNAGNRSTVSYDTTDEGSEKQDKEQDLAQPASFDGFTSSSASSEVREMTGAPSEGGRKEQVEGAREDDVPARLEMTAGFTSDRAKPQSEKLSGRSEGARESEDRTLAVPSEASATNDVSEPERAGSREERLRRENSSHKTGGRMTLGSFLERLSRAKETPDVDEQVIVQGLQRELEPEETGVASRFAAKPEMSQSARAEAQPESDAVRERHRAVEEPEPKSESEPESEIEPTRRPESRPEPVRERYRVAEEATPESKRTAVVRSYEMSARSETRVPQQRGYDRYKPEPEPEPELESEPKPEARLGSESDKTTVIDKSSRPTLPRSVPQTYVADTQTPTTVEETPDPGYDSESDTSNESVRVAQQTSTERGAEANESASREEIGQQSKKNRQPAAKHARNGAAGAKGSGSGGLFSRFKPATKTSTPKAAGRDGQTGTPSLTPAKKSDLPKRKRMLILAIATTIVAAAVAGVVYLITNATPGGSAASAPAQQMLTAMVYRGDFVDAINAEGTVEPLVVMDVTGEVDGVVENLVIGQGSFVTAGDTLFKIRNDALENAVSEANARLSEAERTVNDTDLAYRQSQADYQNAWNIAAMSNNWSTFDQTGLTNAINAAAARRSEAIAARDAANSALVMAQAAVDRCNVRAPITGIVTELNVADGVSVGAGTPDLAGGTTGPLLKVGDITQMKVTTLVAEAYVPFVRPGQVATISFPALPGITQTASVNAVSSMPSGVAADASGSASYAVEFLLAAPDPNLKPGMSASLNIVLQSASDSLIVPSKAIWQEIDENGVTHYFVNVVTDSGELKKCEVSIVAQNNDEAAVWGEVGEGDIVRVNS